MFHPAGLSTFVSGQLAPMDSICVLLLPLLLWNLALASPITTLEPGKPINPVPNGPPPNLCVLPQELDYSGLATLIEDCEQMHRFGTKPPNRVFYFAGASIYVCCPNPESAKDVILFPTDVELLGMTDTTDDTGDFQYGQPTGDYDDLYYNDNSENVPVGQRCASFPGTTCTEVAQCSDEDFESATPQISCGWDLVTGAEKICCRKLGQRTAPAPAKKHGDFDCEDYSEQCKTFVAGNPETCKPDHKSYPFMKFACMKSCNICKDKGCRDEFSKCADWTRQGYCIRQSEFMLFHCRESCGTCGFTSPRNTGGQLVKSKEYSDLTSGNFFCGEGKSKCEVNMQKQEPILDARTDSDKAKVIKPAQDQKPSDRKIGCGSILISDRFILFAGHCSTQFDNKDQRTQIRTSIVRDGTIFQDEIEIRRVFVHPDFHFPSLYYDLAIAELGRRIVYDYDVYGDSPSCLSTGQPIVNKLAVSQGYGFTEKGQPSTDVLLGVNVTIISNEDCTTWLRGNTTNNLSHQTTLREQLSDGINEQMLCTTGIYNDTAKVWTGPCEGDSGGPLYVNFGGPNGERKQTLEGIVSGALTCGGNIPAWYTKVFPFRSWIECVIREVNKNRPSGQVEKTCLQFAKKFQPQNKIV